MEAIHPKLREELKRVYPQLTDADIDRYEELTSLRFTFNPATEAGKIREIDEERDQLVRDAMPRLGELENAFFDRARQASPRIKAPPRIEIKTSDKRGRPRIAHTRKGISGA
jgi:hypothetical protein